MARQRNVPATTTATVSITYSTGPRVRTTRSTWVPDRVLQQVALQFTRLKSSRLQGASTRIQPDPLSATLGLGPHVEFHSSHALVEVPAQDADVRGITSQSFLNTELSAKRLAL